MSLNYQHGFEIEFATLNADSNIILYAFGTSEQLPCNLFIWNHAQLAQNVWKTQTVQHCTFQNLYGTVAFFNEKDVYLWVYGRLAPHIPAIIKLPPIRAYHTCPTVLGTEEPAIYWLCRYDIAT